MLERYLSRKLVVTVLTNLLTVFMVFGGAISGEQAAAIIALVNSFYLGANSYQHAHETTECPVCAEYDEDDIFAV